VDDAHGEQAPMPGGGRRAHLARPSRAVLCLECPRASPPSLILPPMANEEGRGSRARARVGIGSPWHARFLPEPRCSRVPPQLARRRPATRPARELPRAGRQLAPRTRMQQVSCEQLSGDNSAMLFPRIFEFLWPDLPSSRQRPTARSRQRPALFPPPFPPARRAPAADPPRLPAPCSCRPAPWTHQRAAMRWYARIFEFSRLSLPVPPRPRCRHRLPPTSSMGCPQWIGLRRNLDLVILVGFSEVDMMLPFATFESISLEHHLVRVSQFYAACFQIVFQRQDI
jgi:hypothetical protein